MRSFCRSLSVVFFLLAYYFAQTFDRCVVGLAGEEVVDDGLDREQTNQNQSDTKLDDVESALERIGNKDHAENEVYRSSYPLPDPYVMGAVHAALQV